MTGLCTTVITDSKGFPYSNSICYFKKYAYFVTHYFQLGNRLLEDFVVNYSKTSVRVVEKCVDGRNLLLACVNKTTPFKLQFC